MKSLTRFFIAFCACNALALVAFAGTEALPQRDSKDKEVMAAPSPSCDYSWTGFYIGANAGYGWGNADTKFIPLPSAASFNFLAPTTRNPDPDGFIGGAQLGYNFQWKCLVLGVEADFQGSDMEGSEKTSPVPEFNAGGPNNPESYLVAHERTQWFGTARARIGFAPFCRMMVYATGGLAYANVDYSANTTFAFQGGPFNDTSAPVAFTKTKAGWTVGGGVEYALSHHWSLKAEYLYYDLGDERRTQGQVIGNFTDPVFKIGYNFETTANIARVGLNFKF